MPCKDARVNILAKTGTSLTLKFVILRFDLETLSILTEFNFNSPSSKPLINL